MNRYVIRWLVLFCLTIGFISSSCSGSANFEPNPETSFPNSTIAPSLTPSQTPLSTFTLTPEPNKIPQTVSNCPLGGWTQFTTESGLADNFIHTLAVDYQGRVWVGHFVNQIQVLENGAWRNLELPPKQSLKRATHILPLPNNQIWISTDSGITAFFNGSDWQFWFFPMAYDLEISSEGLLWAGTTQGLYQLIMDDWQPSSKPVPESRQFAVKSLQIDDNGELWVGGKYGLYTYRNGLWTFMNDLVDVTAIDISESGTLWFGTRFGLVGYEGDGFISPEGDKELVESPVESLSISPSGEIWIVNTLGIWVYADGTWQQQIPSVGSEDLKIYSVEIDPWSAAWFSTSEGVLCYLP